MTMLQIVKETGGPVPVDERGGRRRPLRTGLVPSCGGRCCPPGRRGGGGGPHPLLTRTGPWSSR